MRRYETLSPDDILRICDGWADLTTQDPEWCKSEYNEELDQWDCPEGSGTCDDCLRKWLEEEVTAEPVMHPTWGRAWYSKQFVMEQVAALIEHDASDLDLFNILDEVLADTPEEIKYASVAKYYEAKEEEA